jgi:hypothetical protein
VQGKVEVRQLEMVERRAKCGARTLVEAPPTDSKQVKKVRDCDDMEGHNVGSGMEMIAT